MKNHVKTIGALLLAATASFAAPGFMGTWSNVTIGKGGDPHASGIEIQLWQKDGKYLGYMAEYVGPVADPPVGQLDAIKVDEKTGAISFTAKLSVGVAPAAGGNAWVPTKNLYEFKGTFSERAITGTLRRKSVQDDGTGLAYDESLTLAAKHRDPDGTFEAWSRRWNDALKSRGPKW